MKDNATIHQLAKPNMSSGKIRFIHCDGKEHFFYSCINFMTESRMSGFDNKAPSVDDSLHWVRSVFKDIRNKAIRILEVIGDF